MAASQGTAISAAKRVKLSPLAANASRLVRLETGSSSQAVFDRWAAAYACGFARAPSRAAVANTTGVSSTTVASRLRTAVITEAATKTAASSRRDRPAAAPAIHPPQASNSPSSSQSRASTSTAARNPITGPSCCACARAWSSEIAPAAITTAAAGTAATASGQPNGRITAHPSTTSSRTANNASASDALRTRTSQTRPRVSPHRTRPVASARMRVRAGRAAVHGPARTSPSRGVLTNDPTASGRYWVMPRWSAAVSSIDPSARVSRTRARCAGRREPASARRGIARRSGG